MSKTARAANTMEISLRVLWEIKVDDNVYGLNIDTTCEEIGADEVTADTITEIVENAVTVGLEHFGMAVKARITKFGDLLGEKLYTVRRVTKDDGLIDLELMGAS